MPVLEARGPRGARPTGCWATWASPNGATPRRCCCCPAAAAARRAGPGDGLPLPAALGIKDLLARRRRTI
jgi:hypothetical protein